MDSERRGEGIETLVEAASPISKGDFSHPAEGKEVVREVSMESGNRKGGIKAGYRRECKSSEFKGGSEKCGVEVKGEAKVTVDF